MAEDQFEWLDKEAIAYIKKNIFPEYRGKLTDNQIQYILDCEYDYYEDLGYFDDDNDEDRNVEIDEDEVFEAVCKRVETDGRIEELPSDIIGAILDANYQFCIETGVFDDEEEEDSEKA
ncbi:MAG: hypothetical protein MJZ23_05430 [Paludibacteraceae bacterium]|nr:hypothetical protein [Paludibacteraceae bacterium]